MAFNPDAYLASKQSPAGSFDPDAYLAKKVPSSLWDKAKANVSAALSTPGTTGGPLSLPAQGYDVINQAAGKLGEKAATSIAENGISTAPLGAIQRPAKVNPLVAAAIGTGVAMTPDIVSAVASPIAEADIAPGTAVGPARRALGYSKRLLQTPFARREATSAAATALREGVIPGAGNPDVMMERAQNLRMKTGQALGDIRGSVGQQPIDEVLNNLTSLEKELTGMTNSDAGQNIIDKGEKIGGIQGQKLKQIQFAKDTLKNLQFQENPTLNDVIKAKNDIGQTINWLSDNATQSTHKSIVKSIEDSVGAILGKNGADLGQYNYLKKVYGASKSMIKALNNEISSQEGNAAVSLPSMGIAAGELASGNPMGALKATTLWELAKRRGSGITAAALNKARIPTGAVNPLLSALKKKDSN